MFVSNYVTLEVKDPLTRVDGVMKIGPGAPVQVVDPSAMPTDAAKGGPPGGKGAGKSAPGTAAPAEGKDAAKAPAAGKAAK